MKKAGWSMTALFALFMMVGSAAPKLFGAQVALESMANIGWPSQHLLLIGVIEITCTLLFLVPRTALIGAILLTGLFGGALASHLRVGSPLFSHTLFSIYLGVFMWCSLYFRDGTIRQILPFIKKPNQE
jgi:hypothetical protein